MDHQPQIRPDFGYVPAASQPEQVINLPRPVPVFMTYLTVAPSPTTGVVFRPDPYGMDALAMPQMFGPSRVASADDRTERRS